MYNLMIPGWMPEDQLLILERLAQQVPKKGVIVEVGSFCGRSSWCLAKTAKSATVYCIDIWDRVAHPYTPPSATTASELSSDFGVAASADLTEGTLDNFKAYTADCPNITPLQGGSPGGFLSWDKKVDLVFLDGLHHNPGFHADLVFWFQHLKEGGTIAGDDCARTHPDVLWTVHDFCKDMKLSFTVEGRIWSIKLPKRR